MEKSISIAKFLVAIIRLPEDEHKKQKGIWYLSQKEHWLGWLGSYYGPGAYNRKNWHRDAKFVYNHVVCPGLLLYLVHAIPLRQELIDAADMASQTGRTEMEQAGAIRKVVPWSEVYQALWGNEKESIIARLIHK